MTSGESQKGKKNNSKKWKGKSARYLIIHGEEKVKKKILPSRESNPVLARVAAIAVTSANHDR